MAHRIGLAARLLHGGLLILLVGAVSLSLQAHEPGLSTAEGRLQHNRFELTLGFAPADVQQFLPVEFRSGERWDESDFESIREQLEVLQQSLWEVRLGAGALNPTEADVRLLPGDNVSFSIAYDLPDTGGLLILHSKRLAGLPAGHRQFVVISDSSGTIIAQALLSATNAGLEVQWPGAGAARLDDQESGAGGATTAWAFVKLGVAHIWAGLDHLLFLFALLVVCQSFRSIVAIVSCFTLAHSITLALATLDWVDLPSRFVEPAIAASIVYVGAENLWLRGKEPRGRWLLTFVFGLVHGFGFARVLRDLGVGNGAGTVWMPLLTFNLGVEIGQVIIAGAVLPLIWHLRKSRAFVLRGVPVLSSLVALAGMHWLLARTVFA